MQPEFLQLKQEYAECLWRVPLTFGIILPASFFLYYLNELNARPERHKDSPFWIVTLGLKRAKRTWVICGNFCDN